MVQQETMLYTTNITKLLKHREVTYYVTFQTYTLFKGRGNHTSYIIHHPLLQYFFS